MKALTTKIVNHGTHGTHGTHGKNALLCVPCVQWFVSRQFRVFRVFRGLFPGNSVCSVCSVVLSPAIPWFNSWQFRGFIPLAGRERLLRSTGPWVPQDCSVEGPRESLGGSQPVSSH